MNVRLDTPTTLSLDLEFDVRQRLAQLRTWRTHWEKEQVLLNERLVGLNVNRQRDVQRAAHILRWQQRSRLRLIQVPLEITPDTVRHLGYETLRHHLAGQFASLTQAERLDWLHNFLFILTPDLRQLSDKISQVRHYASLGQGRHFLLGGASGMGKTTYLDWLAAVYAPTVEAERNRVPLVKIDAPVSNHTAKPLLHRMMLECGLTYTRYDTEEDLLVKLAWFFQACGTELLVVDEVEHITRPLLRRRLLEVSNLARGVPIICASCHPQTWVQGDSEVAGRWNDYFELRPYTGERLCQLLTFVELMLPFTQPSGLAYYDLPRQAASRSTVAGPARLIEQWTGGILRDILILIVDASARAITHHLPKLSPRLLQTTWQAIQTHQVTDFFSLFQQESQP